MAIQTDLAGIRVHPKPLPGWVGDAWFPLDYSLSESDHSFTVRDNDMIEFRDHNVSLHVHWVYSPKDETVEVDSSAVKVEVNSRVEAGEDEHSVTTNEEQEHTPPLYSTGREQHTPKQEEASGSEVIQETPSKVDSVPDIIANHHTSETDDNDRGGGVEEPATPRQTEVSTLSDITPSPEPTLPVALNGNPATPTKELIAQHEDRERHDPFVQICPPRGQEQTSETLQSPRSSGQSTVDDDLDEGPSGKSSVNSPNAEDAPENGQPANPPTALRQGRGRKRNSEDSGLQAPRSKRNRTTSDDQFGADPYTPTNSAPSSTPTGTQSGRRLSPRATQNLFSSHKDYTGPDPLILFPTESTIPTSKGLMKFLAAQKASKISEMKKANFFCVTNGDLKTTAKLLHSLTMGNYIVTGDWVVQSSKANRLLDPADFVPEPLKSTIHLNRRQLFAGEVLYVSPKLRADYKKGWDEIHSILTQAGGPEIINTPARKLKEADRGRVTIYLGSETGDADAELLQETHKFHKKDLISASIVAGTLLTDKAEFTLGEVIEVSSPPVKAKRGMKKL